MKKNTALSRSFRQAVEKKNAYDMQFLINRKMHCGIKVQKFKKFINNEWSWKFPSDCAKICEKYYLRGSQKAF